ncbi:MAG: DUF1028 domain-containing protein [Burkholderiales bacterium]|nr:DUF1028 domain-containing protein [Burkholderiales bacterium]
MTFAIAGHCEKTGRFGVAISTRPIGVGARCAFIAPNFGVVVSMAYTDPRLGILGTNLLRTGYSAARVLAEIEVSDPNIEHRQICVIDRDGNAVARTGKKNKDWSGAFIAPNLVAMGNNLVSEKTAAAMESKWISSPGTSLDERLLACLEAGRDAGGQNGGQRSAGLLVYDREVYPYVDLRVDLHSEPIGELRRVYSEFSPLIPYYYQRPGRPDEFGREPEWLERQAAKK